MKIKLVHDARVEHKEGEVVETTPACANVLVSLGMAEYVDEAKEMPKKEKKVAKK